MLTICNLWSAYIKTNPNQVTIFIAKYNILSSFILRIYSSFHCIQGGLLTPLLFANDDKISFDIGSQ